MRLVTSCFAIVALAGSALAQTGPSLPAADPYFSVGQQTLAARRAVKPNKRHAKNVILFIGDGMDPTTVAAARIFDGQSRGEEGEENYLSFERFPYLAMAKTYSTSNQIPDSAGTMSAMMTGVKTKSGVISVTDVAELGDCKSSLAAKALTIGELAEMSDLATGVISTSLLTDATPAAVYSHAASRRWQADVDLPEQAAKDGCHDIARQLIEFPYGDGLELALGGGRANFLPEDITDPEYPEREGRRTDRRNLAEEWTAKSTNHRYVWNKADFDSIDPKSAPRILGLFEPSVMQYEADRTNDGAGEPSLAEMTGKAIDILSQNENGFFLMVEAGRIDHAHHAGNAARALRDAQALSKAVALARSKTSEKDTLVIVTADHGHTLVIQGYAKKGNDILGLSTNDDGSYALAGDGKPYTTLSYANGPGSVLNGKLDKDGRPAPTPEGAKDISYRQQSLIPSSAETHGGQDVTIYASGPHAYLFGGIVEQNYVFHVIDDALDLTKRAGVK
jgi:alkaline phosphatase